MLHFEPPRDSFSGLSEDFRRDALGPSLAFPLPGRAPVADPFDDHARFDLTQVTPIPLGPAHPGAFGVARAHHIHEGVDLYAPEGSLCVSAQDGQIVHLAAFTGPEAGSPWWESTWAVGVEGPFGVILHGEIAPLPELRLGHIVRAGDPLGRVARVLRKDKGRPRSMLHVQLHASGCRALDPIWLPGCSCPEGLLDPTDLILRAAGLRSGSSVERALS